jgi:predicted transcriptional regulator YdeE
LKTPERRHAAAKQVAGIAIRTTNDAEMNAATGQIPGLWSQFRQRTFDQLEKLGAFGPPIGVYSAYESDATGSYQLLAGREVHAGQSLPKPLTTVRIPEGAYLVFTFTGQLPESVQQGWQTIWQFFAGPDAPARAFTYDFEVYREADRVEIWIAVIPRKV